jgi:sarcosine oxidase
MAVETTDVIVLGLGAMGSAAAQHLAKRGVRVIGFDAFEQGHSHGASHGHSRIVRQAYHEAPDYVPLIKRAYDLWHELEAASGEKLLYINGGLIIGQPDGRTVRGTILSAEQHGLPYERLSQADIAARYPGFQLHDDLIAVLEPNAGHVRAAVGLRVIQDEAVKEGAMLRFGERIDRWTEDANGVTVETAQGTYRADRLVIMPGPWSNDILGDLGIRFDVQRVVNAHFRPKRPELYVEEECPIFSLLVPEGHFYGMPGEPELGVKIGKHDHLPSCTPETVRREIDDSEIDLLRAVLDRYVPFAGGAEIARLTCLYTMSPDKHFIVDKHPHHDRVTIGCGFSGHGFKFTPVIGEILADLALNGRTDHPIAFLSAERFVPVA